MRIGIDGRLWNETGVGRYIRSLFKYLPEVDRQNEYVWFLGPKEYDSLVMPSPKWKKVLADVHWHTLREQLILPGIFWREHLDLLHFPYFTFPILYPGRFVVTIHDLIIDHYKTGQWSTLPGWLFRIKKLGYHLVNWVAIFRAEKIFTLSYDAKRELVSHYKARPDKVVVTHESGVLEAQQRDFSDREYKRMRDLKPYLLYVGNAHQHKNVEGLVKAVKILRKTNRELKIVLVGSDKFFYPRLEKWTLANGYSEDVVSVGEVPNSEIAGWYHFAEALVTASFMEGFGIPPLEAMSLGVPAIVSDIPVFHEVYADAAVYFDQRDPNDIARVIRETLKNKEKLGEKIKLGYNQAANYSWRKMVVETHKVYESCLGLRPD